MTQEPIERCLHPELSALWLCSEPWPSHDELPPPDSDDEGGKVTAKNLITAATAAEIAVETSDREMNDGDELEVWVWQPGCVAQAKSYLVRVSWSWNFSGRPNAGGMARELAAQDSEPPTKQNG